MITISKELQDLLQLTDEQKKEMEIRLNAISGHSENTFMDKLNYFGEAIKNTGFDADTL